MWMFAFIYIVTEVKNSQCMIISDKWYIHCITEYYNYLTRSLRFIHAWPGGQGPICDNQLEIKQRWRARQLWLSIFACWMTEEAICTGCCKRIGLWSLAMDQSYSPCQVLYFVITTIVTNAPHWVAIVYNSHLSLNNLSLQRNAQSWLLALKSRRHKLNKAGMDIVASHDVDYAVPEATAITQSICPTAWVWNSPVALPWQRNTMLDHGLEDSCWIQLW